MLILVIILGLICAGLIFGLVYLNQAKLAERRYLQDAIFRSWVRETEIQCRKSAYKNNRKSPIVESQEVNGIKQILISNPATDTEPKVLLAAININFKRVKREVNIGCSQVVAFDKLERWPIDGEEWSPISLIKNELWKYFPNDLNHESTYDFQPEPSTYIANVQ